MTSLTFHLARSLEDYLKGLPSYPNINIIVTNLDHDANVSPWVRLAENIGVEIRALNFKHDSCTLDMSDFDRKLDDKTVLVCLGLASNACGTISPVKQMIK
jgi:selenocysteine lyase/cysteine desulfurase